MADMKNAKAWSTSFVKPITTKARSGVRRQVRWPGVMAFLCMR